MLVNILRTFIKTEEIKDKKASDLDFLKCSRRQKSAGIEGYWSWRRNKMLLKELNSHEATKESKKMLNFYIAAAQHLRKNLPLDYKI